MIKLIDIILAPLVENKEYKIELKNGKSMTKFLSDTDYAKIMANMKLPTGTVKSVEPTGKSVKIEPDSKSNPSKASKVNDNADKPLFIGLPTMMEIILQEDVYSKKPGIKDRVSPFIQGHLGGAEVPTEKIGDYLRKRDPGNNILPSEDSLFTNAYERYKRDKDAVTNVAEDVADTVIEGREELNSPQSDIKTYLQYWESKYNPHRKSNLYNEYLKMLKTKVNTFKK